MNIERRKEAKVIIEKLEMYEYFINNKTKISIFEKPYILGMNPDFFNLDKLENEMMIRYFKERRLQLIIELEEI